MKKIHPWYQDPTIIELLVNTNIDPKLTIVIPMFNQAKIIENILYQLFNSIELPFDLIIINDASEDNSSEIVRSFLSNTNFTKIVNAILIENYSPIYETACDNLGFKMARTEYILEFQSDIYVNHKGFEKKMIDAIEKFNLTSVSGRLVCHYSVLEGAKAWFKYPLKKLQFSFNLIDEGKGLMGHKIFQNKQFNKPDNFIFIGETVARGPWLLKKSILEKLNYLDQENYFLGNDDHDFHFRARKLIQIVLICQLTYIVID
jgi:glycosyltransferase involved in cell wall biosynthesis